MAIWSTWGLAVRWLPVPPWALTGYAGAVAALVAAACWLARGGAARDLWPRGYRWPLIFMGLLFLANNVCFLTAYQRTTVANAVLTHYTAPVFVAVLAPLTLRERVLPVTPISLVLAGAGMALLLPGIRFTWEDRHLQGLVLGTASGVAYAGLIVFARALSIRVASLPLLLTQNLVIAAVLAPGLIPLAPSVQGQTWGLLMVVGTVHALGGGLLYLAGIRRVSAQAAAILGYLEPLLAAVWGAALLGETLGGTALAGGALILAGGALVVWAEGRSPKAVDAPAGGR